MGAISAAWGPQGPSLPVVSLSLSHHLLSQNSHHQTQSTNDDVTISLGDPLNPHSSLELRPTLHGRRDSSAFAAHTQLAKWKTRATGCLTSHQLCGKNQTDALLSPPHHTLSLVSCYGEQRCEHPTLTEESLRFSEQGTSVNSL